MALPKPRRLASAWTAAPKSTGEVSGGVADGSISSGGSLSYTQSGQTFTVTAVNYVSGGATLNGSMSVTIISQSAQSITIGFTFNLTIAIAGQGP